MEIDHGATFNTDRTRRYVLRRIWEPSKPLLMWIGLNPSTANETEPDPTITKIYRYCRKWGYGGFYMLNLFTQVTPYPEKLTDINCMSLADLNVIVDHSKKVDKIVFCWGQFKFAKLRSEEIIKRFPNAYCLGWCKDGSPLHPMYKNPHLKLVKYARE